MERKSQAPGVAVTDGIVAIAYVTKWALTRGIVVWRNARVSSRAGALLHPEYGQTSHATVIAKHWTADRGVAEERWRIALETEANRLRAQVKKFMALHQGAPVYAEETESDA